MGETNFFKHHEIIEEYLLEIDEKAITKIGQICVDREGKPYAIKQTFGIAWTAIVWILTGRDIKNPLADGDKETNCIEEWGTILAQALGVEPPEHLDGLSVKPFRDWIAALPMAKLTYKKLD
jgi:hypothetical protein